MSLWFDTLVVVCLGLVALLLAGVYVNLKRLESNLAKLRDTLKGDGK